MIKFWYILVYLIHGYLRSLKVFCIYIPVGAYICICEFSHLYRCFENILQFCLEVIYKFIIPNITEGTAEVYNKEYSIFVILVKNSESIYALNFQEKFVCWILLPYFHMHYLAGTSIWILSARKNSHLQLNPRISCLLLVCVGDNFGMSVTDLRCWWLNLWFWNQHDDSATIIKSTAERCQQNHCNHTTLQDLNYKKRYIFSMHGSHASKNERIRWF